MAMAQEITVERPEANFSPSIWGDLYINYSPDSLVSENYSKTIEVMKGEVKRMLIAIDPAESSIVVAMNLIDTLERLGISYHFQDEIEQKLQQFFNLVINNPSYYDELECYDLALHFRLFRQHGYRISSGVFRKFTNDNGDFDEELKGDPRGLLSLYEAAHLRVHGEAILEHAIVFTTACLRALLPSLDSLLREQVEHALRLPLHFCVPRIEICYFITHYEQDHDSKNDLLLKFAKCDFNLLQILHKQELSQLSRWWKELDLVSKLPYARDRLVECYYWAISVYYEAQYSRARVILAKTIIMTSVIDDTYDAYGTVEELRLFTDAIDRWNIREIDGLPEYMKPLYRAVLELYQQFEEELTNDWKSDALSYAIKELKELVRSYYTEAIWSSEEHDHLPTFSEYMENGIISSTYFYHGTTALLGMEMMTTLEDFQRLSQRSKLQVASSTKCRAIDDISTYEVEKKRRLKATGIDIYMNDKGVTMEEAFDEFMEIVRNSWKDTNEECLKPISSSTSDNYPLHVLMRIINLDRALEVAYMDREDGYTNAEVLKPYILAMFDKPFET